MKKNWLLYLVIFSLALNLGTIGTFAYLRYRDGRAAAVHEEPPLPLRALWGELRLDASQRRELRGLFPEHRRKVMDLRQALTQKRQELFVLIKGETPSGDAIQGKVKEISALQGNLEEEMARFLVELKGHLKPEQQAAFLDKVQTRLGCGPDACGPMGPGEGWRRGGKGMGRGMGPHGPGGPPGPPPPPGGPGGPGWPEPPR